MDLSLGINLNDCEKEEGLRREGESREVFKAVI